MLSLPVSPDPAVAVKIAEALTDMYRTKFPQVHAMKNLVASDSSGLPAMIKEFKVYNDIAADDEQFRQFAEAVRPKCSGIPQLALDDASLSRIMTLVYDDLLGLSAIGPLWRCEKISEILVDSYDRVVVEFEGRLRVTRISYHDKDHALKSIREIATRISGRSLGPTDPMITAELPGARAALAVSPIVRSGVNMAMRRFPKMMGMEDIRRLGALDEEMENFLRLCVHVKTNILVSGGTSSGKTTFINSLSEFIPGTERVISIEDAFELSLKNNMWVPMQTKERSSADDTVVIGLPEILRHTLRMRPDRILVGEIREHEDAAVLLQAANTGHDGTMTTIHASSADEAVNYRLNYLLRKGQGDMPIEVAAAEIASAMDLVVQVVRERGVRFVKEISVVDRALLSGSRIVTAPLWQTSLAPPAEPGAKPTPVFRKAGGVPKGTLLYYKLEEFAAEQQSRRKSTAASGDTGA